MKLPGRSRVPAARELMETFAEAMDEPTPMEQALLSFRRTLAARFDSATNERSRTE